ncbi:MAG: hypothetical protein HY360_03295 [Verrucomicrobia bacterium]|nr:hypothetical protein [Verrucomicrobiota bacterium]
MEEHFLKDFVSGPPGGDSGPWYNPEGDCIIYQTVDEGVIANRIDEILTIYTSAVSGKDIGFQIKGVAAIISRFGWDGIHVGFKENEKELKSISLTFLLLAAYENGPRTIGRRMAYVETIDNLVLNSPRISLNPNEMVLA